MCIPGTWYVCHFVRYRDIHRPPCQNYNNNLGKYKMLPRILYELLPYLYILTGIVSAALIDSTIVLISSMLLIITGVFVLLMRRSFRKSLSQRYEQRRVAYETAVHDAIEKRSGIDRRHRKDAEWPTPDNTGEKISSDRRIADRRVSVT